MQTSPIERAARKGFDFKKVGSNKLTHARGELGLTVSPLKPLSDLQNRFLDYEFTLEVLYCIVHTYTSFMLIIEFKNR